MAIFDHKRKYRMKQKNNREERSKKNGVLSILNKILAFLYNFDLFMLCNLHFPY